MEEKGIVLSQNGNIAEVAVIRVSACGDSCKSCGGSCEQSKIVVNAISNYKLNKGDIVVLGASTNKILISALIAYLIPLIFLIIGSIGGSYILKSYNIDYYEALGFIIGIVFLALSFFAVRYFGNKISDEEFEIIKIEKRV